jgi:hypothetical protein
MPRLARLDAPGVLHHVIIRGIERRKIFKDNKDKDNFLDRLGTLLPETKITCHAWALLSNHAHFLFRTGDTPLSTLIWEALKNVRFSGQDRRSLLCFWAVRELGMSLADLARELEMSIPGIGYTVERGETIAHDNKYQLIS